MTMNMAGVTFNNDKCDGGENRQSILEYLMNKLNRNIITLNLEYTSFDGEQAIKCREKYTGKVVGWIPKKFVATVAASRNKQMTGFIGFVKMKDGTDCYYVEITEQERPTPKQYTAMKYICREHNIQMPAYDKRAYKQVFAKVNESKPVKNKTAQTILDEARKSKTYGDYNAYEYFKTRLRCCNMNYKEFEDAITELVKILRV